VQVFWQDISRELVLYIVDFAIENHPATFAGIVTSNCDLVSWSSP